MTDVVQAPEISSLADIERALRPLRRVLARGGADRALVSGWFAGNCARLATPIGALSLPTPLTEDRDVILTAFEAIDAQAREEQVERLLEVERAIHKLDAVLGLPLREPNLFPRPPKRGASKRRGGTRSADGASSEGSERASGGRKGRRRRKGKRDTVDITDIPLVVEEAASPAADTGPSSDLSLRWDGPLGEGSDGEDERTLFEWLSVAPLTHDVFAPVHGAGRDLPEGAVAAGGRVMCRVTRLRPDGGATSEVTLQGAGRLTVTWGRTFTGIDLQRLCVGSKVVVAGQATAEGALIDARMASAHQGRALAAHYADPAVADAVAQYLPEIGKLDDVLSSRILTPLSLIGLDQAITRLHERVRDKGARKRLAFDELLALQLGLSHPRFEAGTERGVAHTIVHKHVAELEVRELGVALSDEAQEAFETIKRELRTPSPMRRVLTGTSASGVDDVALQTLLTIVENRSQVMVVAADVPAAVVAFNRWEALFKEFGIRAVLIGGEPKRDDREAMRKGEIHIVFGPPNMLDHSLEFRRLGLVLALEQARYGEVPARAVAGRSPRPDVLVVTRTPLPPAVLFNAYPSFDLTVLSHDDTPAPGTVWGEPEREQAYRALGEAVAAGGTGMLVFPMKRGGSDLLSLREAATLVATLKEQFLDGAEVVLFHGAMSGQDRVRAWSDFTRRRAPVLVATTLVEQLAPPPRAATIVIEHADRADAQRLMGIRGLARESGHVHYVLSAEVHEPGHAFVQRLADKVPAFELVNDPGAVFEVADSCGTPVAPSFRFYHAKLDPTLLPAARDAAHAMLAEDPNLRQGQAGTVLRMAHTIWGLMFDDTPCPLPAPRAAPSRRRRRRRRRR